MISRNRFLLGQYRPGTAFLYRLDARTKILLVLALMISALESTDLAFYAGLIVLLVVLLVSCRLSGRLILNNLKPVVWFIAFTAIFHLLFSGKHDPDIAFHVGPLAVSDTAVLMAVTYSARILIFVMATFILSLTTSPLSLSEAVVSLLKPLRLIKIPIYDLGMILFIALRFIPVLVNEVDTIRKAQFIRGVTISGSFRTRLKRSVALVLPVFFSALRRADDLSVAIETRGYRSGKPRSSLHPLKFATIDYVVLTIIGVSAIVALAGTRFLW
jgi:energy-coupling factor transport system permease protein